MKSDCLSRGIFSNDSKSKMKFIILVISLWSKQFSEIKDYSMLLIVEYFYLNKRK